MARHSVRLFTVLAITLFLSFKSVPFAQQAVTPTGTGPVVPRLINFGGVLRDANGQALQGVIGVTLSLYKDQQGGAPVWTENQNVQLDEQGRYSVLLGVTQASGLPIDLFVSGESRWLGVQAQLSGSEEQPRVLLVSVPYALKAVDADTIGGKPASAFLLAQPADPTQPGNTSTTGLKPLPRDAQLSGATGTPNALTKWLNATGDLGDSKVYEVNGNVGVNNPNPIGQFDLVGASGLGAEAGGLHVTDTNVTPNKVIQIGYDDGSDVGFIRAYQSSTGSKNLVLNPQGGNVGVGTTNPIGEFEVSTQGTYNAEAGGLHVTNNATSPSKVAQMGYDNNVDAGFIRAYQSSTGVKPLLLNPSGGFVGIGTTTPAATLDVAGDLKVEGNILGTLNFNAGATLDINGTSFLSNFGIENTFVGQSAGNFTMLGAALDNTGIGTGALNSLTSGGGNTATGSNALPGNTSGFNNTATGLSALADNTVGCCNTAIGVTALGNNQTGSFNTAVGLFAGFTGLHGSNGNTTGSNNTFIGAGSGPGTSTQLNNATAIGSNAVVSADNTLVLGTPGVMVAIGASTAATTLQVVGDIRVGTSGTNGCIQGFGGAAIAGTCSSDMRLKRDIEPFATVLDKVTQLQPVYYNWNDQEYPEYHFGNQRTQGLIAQDVEKIFPNMVATDDRGYKAVNYSELPLLLLQAVRELKAENDALKSEIETLKAR